MSMKTCSKCNAPLDQFPKRGLTCRSCLRECGRIYRKHNYDKYRNYVSKRKDRLRRFIYEFYLSNPCVDCKEDNIIKLDCDHIRDKKFQISTAINKKVSIGTLRAELSKCEVRCANCHRRRTLSQFGTLKKKYFDGDLNIVEISDGMNWNKKRKTLNRKMIYDRLSVGSCIDCNENDPLILEFDHFKDKMFQISEALYKPFSKSKLEMELEKCELRCVNCHRWKTAVEQGHPLLTFMNS